ncbi:MAG: hypothetical protein LIP23_10055 [Planctomycetes bacterium]|nr:hypothetical protein [Planctomycetota bacterium]
MVSGVNGANSMMADLMRVLMQGMQEQMDLSKQMLAVGLDTSFQADKMALAQNIIDVYA